LSKPSYPVIGQLVQVKRGKEAGKYAIVIALVDEKFVLLADGDKRKFDRPKKKNNQHVSPVSYISMEIVESLQESGRVTNAKLRFAISKYLEDHPPDEKGD
jgi:large subunit ribosomal protein L14e